MNELQWFKFNPSKWFMGRIQRCSEIAQARFIRLCCLYWSKQCKLSKEDAQIEIDEKYLNELEKKKVLLVVDGFISIDFLDTQFCEISEKKSDLSNKGKIGNLKRWNPDVYKKYKAGKISLNDALEIAKVSPPDCPPIADDRREDKRREEKIRKEQLFADWWNIYDYKSAGSKKEIKKKWNKLSLDDMQKAINHSKAYVLATKDKQYRKYPNTYLNQRHFEAYLPEVKPKTTTV